MPPLLEVRNLTVRIDSSVVLRDVSFELQAGDALLVLGPNGAGKTVLLRALLGVVPTEGKVRWSASGPPPGYLPQRLDVERHLPMCGEDLLKAKAALLGLDESQISAALERVGISPEIASSPIGHRSVGRRFFSSNSFLSISPLAKRSSRISNARFLPPRNGTPTVPP
jgi:zinc transport system ATP-binding protein